jgi:predicted ATPase
VVIDAATRRQIGGLFDCREFGPVKLKGLKDPVLAWTVIGESTVEGRFAAFHPGTLTPLIGREDDLELLLARWHQAKAGEGQVALISGEPGIGKSRLIAELEERLRGDRHVSLRYFCSPHHQDSALFPIITRWRREAGLSRDDPPADQLSKLEALILPMGTPIDDFALIADLLEIPLSDRYAPLTLSPQQKRERTLHALTRRLVDRAREQPVLMLFEDAHWADQSSLELLDATIGLLADLPVLLVASFRPEFIAPWIGHTGVSLINLSRLNRDRSGELAAQVTMERVLPSALIEQIVSQADGVPLFIEELTKSVLDSVAQEGHLAPATAVPATLQASLMARLDRLPAARQVAQIGAVIGRDFGYRLLASVAPIQERDLADGLDELVSSGLAYRQGEPPDATYTFKHALVQDIAYESLLRSRRQDLHRRVALALEKDFPGFSEAQPEIIAHHCTNAGLVEKAIAHWLRAGEQAIARSALVEAIAQIQKGLDLLPYLTDSVERDRQELTLQLALGGALIAVSGYASERAGRTYVRARQLGERLGYAPGLIRALWGEFVHHHVRGEMDRSHRAATEMLKLAETGEDNTSRVAAHRAVGDSFLHLGQLAQARAHLENGVRLFDAVGHVALTSFLFAEDARIGCLSFLSITLANMGLADQAIARTGQALEEARGLSHATSLAFALSAACRVYSTLGNMSAVAGLAEELIALAAEQHFSFFHSTGSIYRGLSLVESGEVAVGTGLLQDGIASFKATGAGWILPLLLGWLATAYARGGKPREGLDQLATALALSRTTGVRCYEAEVQRLKGELLLSDHVRDYQEAEVAFCGAVELAREQDAKLFELRAAVSLTRLLMKQGRLAEARDLLPPVHAWFTEGFDMPYLREAAALASRLGQPELKSASA